MFKIMSKRPASVLKPLNAKLNLVVDIISLQQLEYEMESADLPDGSIFLKSDIVVTLSYLRKYNFSKATKLILSHFQEEYHLFIYDTP